MKVLALVDGVVTEVLLVSCPVKFITLSETNGDPIAVDPRDVSRVEWVSATRSRVQYKSGGSTLVNGNVPAVKALLEG